MFRNLGSNAQPVHIQGSATSYFSAPESDLDPKLFSGNTLNGWVRNGQRVGERYGDGQLYELGSCDKETAVGVVPSDHWRFLD